MPDDHSSARGSAGALAGTGLEEFADPPGFKPARMRWELHSWFGRRELPDGPEPENGELLRAQLRYLRSPLRSHSKPDPSRTD